jgi:hypothetical protein
MKLLAINWKRGTVSYYFYNYKNKNNMISFSTHTDPPQSVMFGICKDIK